MPQTIVDRSARSQIGHARQSTCSVCATCIEDWVVVNGGSCPFEAPELRPIQIVGVVSNHPILGNGPITTTLVQMIDQARGVAHTLNAEYELGAPRAKFAAQLAMLGGAPLKYNSERVTRAAEQLASRAARGPGGRLLPRPTSWPQKQPSLAHHRVS